MASPQESVSMAVFCDFENVALGVRDAKIDRFDIKPVLERLLLKGSIVVKKAYCDWERYKAFKASMHEASFELIEIPHVRQSGKNSADIRLVVDALDLCYTKSHVDTFVIVSGDSDFSPLVSKLRENAKKVIGVGVKNSTSDLLVANCDEFIFYDDLVREQTRAAAAKRESGAAAKRPAADERQPKTDPDERKSKAIALAVETLDALVLERGESGKIWASVLKSAIKRRRPDFSETRYGFRAFGNLLDEAQARGLLEVGRDEKSGAYVSRPNQPMSGAPAPFADEAAAPRAEETRGRRKDRRSKRAGASEEPARDDAPAGGLDATPDETDMIEAAAYEETRETYREETADIVPLWQAEMRAQAGEPDETEEPVAHAGQSEAAHPPENPEPGRAAPRRARKTSTRKSPARKTAGQQPAGETAPQPVTAEAGAEAGAPGAPPEAKKKKAPSRARRSRSKATTPEES